MHMAHRKHRKTRVIKLDWFQFCAHRANWSKTNTVLYLFSSLTFHREVPCPPEFINKLFKRRRFSLFQLLPICPWAPFRTAACFCLIDSRILSTSFWYRARSLCAPSLASLRACSNDFTRSCVARRRFSSLGNSHLRSALSLTSC